MSEGDWVTIRALFIALLFANRDRKTLDFSASNFLELGLPAFTRLSDKEQDQTVTGLAAVYVGRTLHTAGEYESGKLRN
jgi:hypothetical protein